MDIFASGATVGGNLILALSCPLLNDGFIIQPTCIDMYNK